ncbi:hypothetical protein LPW11_07740 [Geomonas sp. RF6]|uniref:hypothetical protein n=1 Tax=Geomonas sp. RF6 TaxID=2897342 RepID=UPI001E5239A7|nr:hypothetical protein [Geomonas sp. RF6]UFS72074.1 hypothetical protein LPW11_07740 [Geomonas sp. RF6]
MTFGLSAVAAGLAGKLGEMKTPERTGSPEFKKRQAIREYNALLDRTDPTQPAGAPNMPCLRSEKASRRKKRHDLIRKAQNNAAIEADPAKKTAILASADRLAKDMDRVEDARLALHTYTANEVEAEQEAFLKPLRNEAPPGFKMASLDEMAEDFGVDKAKLTDLLNPEKNPSQRIMVYERDVELLGPGPKYTIAFRGSTLDEADWNNNGQNEAGFEAPHQANAAALGIFLAKGAEKKSLDIDTLVSATGHSKGGSEAQAFAAASGSSARIYNPAGFDPAQYSLTHNVRPSQMRIDRTTVIDRDADGEMIESTPLEPHTDPLYFAQHCGITQFIMKKPVTTGPPRELAPIDPDLSVPSTEESNTEAHSMLQVIEALERDKRRDQGGLNSYVGG